MKNPRCFVSNCDEMPAEDGDMCASCSAEADRWRRHFGQDHPDRAVRRATLEAMTPYGKLKEAL